MWPTMVQGAFLAEDASTRIMLRENGVLISQAERVQLPEALYKRRRWIG